MQMAPLAADTIRRRMREDFGLEQPVSRRRPAQRRPVIRTASAEVLRRLADRLEPGPGAGAAADPRPC
jgi:hypothetical protein